MLRLVQVSRRFGGLQALSAVSLEITAGEIVGLMGANGAGKTTLFSLIAGQIRPTSGAIFFAGRRIDGLRPEAICRFGIARAFQVPQPFAALSLRENVAIAAMHGRWRLPRRDALRRAEATLDEFGLAALASQPASSLTLAALKRLELARALGTGARLLLLDEVMAGLTPAEVAQMLELLRALRERHELTLIVIEHVLRALMEFAQRIVVLHHGELIASGDPERIAADPQVNAVYFG